MSVSQVRLWQHYDDLWPKIQARQATQDELRAVQAILDEKYRLMRAIFQRHHLAVNVATVAWGQGGYWRRLRWHWPKPPKPDG